MIYLDNAATTIHKPQEVIDAVTAAMTTMGNASRGAHDGALTASRTVYEARCKAAKLFGCSRPDHVVFTCNSTEALNIAIQGAILPGSHVITTDLEHNSVLRPLYRVQDTQGIRLDFARADAQGALDLDHLSRLICPETRAIVCTHMSNLTGEMVDISRIGQLAREHGILLIVDASQSAGNTPIDMEKMGIGILCFTGHKGLMGPQGTGGMCIREGVEIRPLKEGGSGVQSYRHRQPEEYPTRLEAGTLNGHGIAGLSAALDYIGRTGVETIGAKERLLARHFYEGVSRIDGVRTYGHFENRDRGPVVALNIRDYDSGEVSDALSVDYDIATRSGAHCAPRMHQALGTTDQGAVRFSFSWFNRMEEVDQAVDAVREIAQTAD
ncbi:MAG TPA: cysteine desulfurase [Lachnospiraceae bacterium]|nr:cysteine desulfurase [Lachnospiraceae bacterium]